MPHIFIKDKTYRGLKNICTLTGVSKKAFVQRALKTFIEDTYDALRAREALKEQVASGEPLLTTDEAFGGNE